MRISHIDNLRWLCVILLFPYHIFMIYNSFGENFYVKGENIQMTTTFVVVTWPWFMPLLFTIAGISTAYALQRRSTGKYVRERITKLFIPLLAGILFVIPAQTYFAERFHNGYTGGYFAQYTLFFTKQTDLTGYTGGFTPGQLWFILYLFIISLAAIPLIFLLKRLKLNFCKMPFPLIPVLFLLPLSGTLILDIFGKSLGEYFTYFILGYLLLSKENIQIKLEKHRLWLLGLALAGMGTLILGWYDILPSPELFVGIFSRFYGWIMILALMGLGKKHLNINNKFTAYMARSSFAVYVFHQTWIVATAYYVLRLTDSPPAQMVLILLASVPATFATYEICRRVQVTRFLFALKR